MPTFRRTGMGAIIGLMMLTGCPAKNTTRTNRIAQDHAAENLAYRAHYGDTAALTTLKAKGRKDPAFLWGLAEYYVLRSNKEEVVGEPLIDQAMLSIPREHKKVSEMDARVAASETERQRRGDVLYSKALSLVQKAAAQGDPAAENDLASEYWTEVMRQSLEMSALDGDQALDLNDATTADWFNIDRRFCADGFRLATQSVAAGWPQAYLTLGYFFLHQKKPTQASAVLTIDQITIKAKCTDNAFPPSISPALRQKDAFLYKAARLGSLTAMQFLSISDCRNGHKKAASGWFEKIRTLAMEGNEEARNSLNQMQGSAALVGCQ